MDLLRKERELIRSAVVEKFGKGLVMTCRKANPETRHSIWYAQVGCLKANNDQIVACVLPLEGWHDIGTQAMLADLEWTSLQTRTTTDQELLASLPIQRCPVRPEVSELSRDVLSAEFVQVDKTKLACTYLCRKLPSLRIDLINEKQTTEWRKTGTLSSCLDAYACIVAFQN